MAVTRHRFTTRPAGVGRDAGPDEKGEWKRLPLGLGAPPKLWVISRKIKVMTKSSLSEDDSCFCAERQCLTVLRLWGRKQGALTTCYILGGPEKPYRCWPHNLSVRKTDPAGAQQWRQEAGGAGDGPSAAVASG